jgi:homoserine kinase type II
MAVYTHLTEDDIKAHLAHYDIGELVAWHGIAEGIENSNFFIKTTQNKFILTLFEKRVNPDDLPFFIGMMQHLAARGISCPKPIAAKNGGVIFTLKDRPAVIISFLEGKGVRTARNMHMALLGDVLAHMHQAADGFALTRLNTMSLPEWKLLAEKVVGKADEIYAGLGGLIDREIHFLENHWPKDLPSGVIHADLFPDNVFYIEHGAEVRMGGVIDFYFACNDFFMYDLAITMNAWCFESMHHEFNITRTSLLLRGYNQVRQISAEELEALPILARGASLRFLLTRCFDWLNPAAGALVKPKDPKEYLRKLQFHQQVKTSREYGL